MDTASSRRAIEKRLCKMSPQVDFTEPVEKWLYSDELRSLLDLWNELADYYVSHDDTVVSVVSVDIVNVYLLRRKNLEDALKTCESKFVIEDLKEAYEELEWAMSKIIAEGLAAIDAQETD